MTQIYRVLKKTGTLLSSATRRRCSRPNRQRKQLALSSGSHWCGTNAPSAWDTTTEPVTNSFSFLKKENKLVACPSLISVIAHSQWVSNAKNHRTSRSLIEQSTQTGEVVLDPFMGSGSTGAAASISPEVLLERILRIILGDRIKNLEALGNQKLDLAQMGVLPPQLNLFS